MYPMVAFFGKRKKRKQPCASTLTLSSNRFLFPCSLVICNDTFAYVFGRYFGKRKLLSLSPNKTIEGFIGGLVFTVIFGYYVSILYDTMV
jgi:CDP-diglyceride synthetase